MWTMLAKQTDLAVGIAKQHQLLAEHLHRLRNVVQFLRRADHQPIAAKPLPGRGSGPDVGNIGNRNFPCLSFLPVFTVESFSYIRDGLNVLNGLNMLSGLFESILLPLLQNHVSHTLRRLGDFAAKVGLARQVEHQLRRTARRRWPTVRASW